MNYPQLFYKREKDGRVHTVTVIERSGTKIAYHLDPAGEYWRITGTLQADGDHWQRVKYNSLPDAVRLAFESTPTAQTTA